MIPLGICRSISTVAVDSKIGVRRKEIIAVAATAQVTKSRIFHQLRRKIHR